MTVQKARKKKNGLLVGLRIRKLRKERSLTQSELAARVGIQQSDLCRMETGEYKVSLETLFKILGVFEMNVAEFFEEAAPRHPSLEAEILDLLQRLGERDKEEVRAFLMFKLSQREQKPQATSGEIRAVAAEGLGLDPATRYVPE